MARGRQGSAVSELCRRVCHPTLHLPVRDSGQVGEDDQWSGPQGPVLALAFHCLCSFSPVTVVQVLWPRLETKRQVGHSPPFEAGMYVQSEGGLGEPELCHHPRSKAHNSAYP